MTDWKQCACGKIAHPTPKLAEAHLKALELRSKNLWGPKGRAKRKPLKVYQCPSGSWHVGHISKKRYREGKIALYKPLSKYFESFNPKIYYMVPDKPMKKKGPQPNRRRPTR